MHKNGTEENTTTDKILNSVNSTALGLENQLSELHSTPKVTRHLSPKMFLKEKFLVGVKRPWFSNKLGEKQVIIVKKVEGKAGADDGVSLRYAPRSFDMGIGGLVSNFDLHHQGVLPTSGTPNSLDHLYLPEMITKDFAKPLDFNGLGQFQSDATSSATGDFAYGQPMSFRGNPADFNYNRGEIEHGSMGGMGGPLRPHNSYYGGHPSNNNGDFPPAPPPTYPTRDNYHHHENDRLPPPSPPAKPESPIKPPLQNSPPKQIPENDKERRPNERRGHTDGPPPGYDRVQGDAGFYNIIDLANLINSNGFPLANLQQQASSSSYKGSSHHDGENDDNRNFNDEFQDDENNYGQFGKNRPDFSRGESGGGGDGRRNYGFDGPQKNSEEQGGYEFSYEHPNRGRLQQHNEGQRGRPPHHSHGRPDFDRDRETPSRHNYDNDGNEHGNYRNRFNSPPGGSSTNWNSRNNNKRPGFGGGDRGEQNYHNLDGPRDGSHHDMNYDKDTRNDAAHPEDGPPPNNDYDSNFDYNDVGRKPNSSDRGENNYDDNPRDDVPNNDDDNYDLYNNSNPKNGKGQRGQHHQRPQEQPDFEDDYSSQEDEQFDNSPQKSDSEEQMDSPRKSKNTKTNNTNHRTPNGFNELMGLGA